MYIVSTYAVALICPKTAIEDGSDDDSAVGSDSESTRSASFASSITAYKYENGRRYHAYREGAYYLPNDDGELYLAPLKNTKRALDFGTGTGICKWNYQMELLIVI